MVNDISLTLQVEWEVWLHWRASWQHPAGKCVGPSHHCGCRHQPQDQQGEKLLRDGAAGPGILQCTCQGWSTVAGISRWSRIDLCYLDPSWLPGTLCLYYRVAVWSALLFCSFGGGTDALIVLLTPWWYHALCHRDWVVNVRQWQWHLFCCGPVTHVLLLCCAGVLYRSASRTRCWAAWRCLWWTWPTQDASDAGETAGLNGCERL